MSYNIREMTSKYPGQEGHVESIELSDSKVERSHSTSENAPSQQNPHDRRLTQALTYLQEEGGNDSPATFIDRVNRIDDALLQELAHQGDSFDHKLYRRVRATVLDAQREFDEALGEGSLHSDSEDEILELYNPSLDEEALYRGDIPDESSSPSPRGAPALAVQNHGPRQTGPKINAERQRVFRYGGPRNDPENWNVDFPGSLPFPETFLMAHWESLKLDYDLSRPKTGGAVGTNVPFTHVELQSFFHLDQYESGSRFKLPPVKDADQNAIGNIGYHGTVDSILDDFYHHNNPAFEKRNYAPRLFLERLIVRKQYVHNAHTPLSNKLRNAMGKSPSPKTGTIPSKRSSPALIEDCLYDTHRTPAPQSTVEKTVTPRPQESLSATKARIKRASSTGSTFRVIGREVKRLQGVEKAQPTPQYTPNSTPKVTPKSTPSFGIVRTHPEVQMQKRGPGRLRKTPSPAKTTEVESIAVQTTEAILVAGSSSELATDVEPTPTKVPTKSSLGKRRKSDGSQPYKPVTRGKSAIKKGAPAAKRAKTSPAKSVGFVDELDEGTEDETETVESGESEDGFHNSSPVKLVRAMASGKKPIVSKGKHVGEKVTMPVAKKATTSPAKKTTKPAAKKVSKAAVARQQAQTSATRSGRPY